MRSASSFRSRAACWSRISREKLSVPWAFPATPRTTTKSRRSRGLRPRSSSAIRAATENLSRRRHGGDGLIAALQRIGDEAVRLHFFDERMQITRAHGAALGRAHRLADFHETSVHHPHVRVRLGEQDQWLLHAGGGVELVLDEESDPVFGAEELRVFERAREK